MNLSTMTPEQIIALAKQLGRPTVGEFADALWRLCSGYTSPLHPRDAFNLYTKCGYKAFQGYPLTRLNAAELAIAREMFA